MAIDLSYMKNQEKISYFQKKMRIVWGQKIYSSYSGKKGPGAEKWMD